MLRKCNLYFHILQCRSQASGSGFRELLHTTNKQPTHTASFGARLLLFASATGVHRATLPWRLTLQSTRVARLPPIHRPLQVHKPGQDRRTLSHLCTGREARHATQNCSSDRGALKVRNRHNNKVRSLCLHARKRCCTRAVLSRSCPSLWNKQNTALQQERWGSTRQGLHAVAAHLHYSKGPRHALVRLPARAGPRPAWTNAAHVMEERGAVGQCAPTFYHRLCHHQPRIKVN